MIKKTLGSKVLLYPIPIVLVGANVNDTPNYNLVGNVGIMSLQPATIYVSSWKGHHTTKGIQQNKTYSVNIPAVGQEIEADYCGIVHGFDEDKSKVFDSFYGELKNAPMATECPINIECIVVKEFPVSEMIVFVGEIVQTYVDQKLEKKGRPEVSEVNPLIYSMEGKYYQIGDFVANAFSIGKQYKK